MLSLIEIKGSLILLLNLKPTLLDLGFVNWQKITKYKPTFYFQRKRITTLINTVQNDPGCEKARVDGYSCGDLTDKEIVMVVSHQSMNSRRLETSVMVGVWYAQYVWMSVFIWTVVFFLYLSLYSYLLCLCDLE